jgi:large subunit ribosomal protein L25
MPDLTLTAETGRTRGSRASNRLRNAGKVPAVVYGHGEDPLPVTVDWRELRAALTTEAGTNALLTLNINGEEQLALVRELQRDPIKRRVDHIDFIRVNRNEQITVDVPIVLVGEPDAVHRENGMIEQVLNTLTVSTTPTNIPNEFSLDISGMTIGDSLRVADLTLPSGVTTDVDAEEAVATALITRSTIETEELEAEAEAAAEAAAGEGDGGEAGEGGEAAGDGGDADSDAAASEGDAG